MSVDMGESLMQSWLRHVKGCDIVQTNWKASMNIGYDKNKAEELLNSIRNESAFDFFAQGKTAENIIRQTEIDALGCIVSKKCYFAGEIAFHEDGLHYKSPDSVPSKMLRTILCLYGYLNASEATVVFATPYIKSKAEKEKLEDFVIFLNQFLKNVCGLKKYQVKLFANADFETNILNPVFYLVDEIKDTSEAFVRACKLIKTTKSIGEISPDLNKEYIFTKYGPIDVSEMATKDLIETFIVPILNTKNIKFLLPFFEKETSSEIFKVSFPFLSYTRDKSSGNFRYYAESYYLEKSKETVYITSECTNRNALISWINENI